MFFLLLLGVVGSHVFTLQVLESEKLKLYAWREHNTVVSFSSRRGEIYDKRGKILALSVPNYSLFYYPFAGESLDRDKLRKIAFILSMSLEELENKIGEGRRFVWVRRHIPKDEAEEIREKIKELKLKSFGFVEEDKRFYPNGDMGLNILGFTGIDDQGLAGIEYAYEDFLRGDRKEIFLRRDAGGGAIPDEKILELPVGTSRRELVLTIDSILQSLCEDILKNAIVKHRAKGGCIIVLESKTAEILAMATYPLVKERNDAISWVLEPGSTLKPFIVAAAIEENIAYPGMRFFCPGYIVYADRKIGDIKTHGALTLLDVVSESCNVGMISLALKMPPELIYRYLLGFGFGDYTNVDLPGEEKGLLREPQQWYGSSRAVIGIGQGIGVTPIQLVNAMNVIANKGVLLKPVVVKELRDNGKVVYRASRTEVRRVISRDTAKILEEMLIAVVERGTGKKASIPGIRVAGKTGTAQIPIKGGYLKGEYISSFIGYFPVEDPQWIILVIIDRPSGGEYYGGEVAAPIFAEIGNAIFNIYGWGVKN
ncbi:MAG: penicillin-binding protein 2 [Synergistetes bacterium]|nr:penicillin-binding protein 2 [Synergistota bacterium]MDW8192050.1 penicillin-binding protein 2 [Synergistota bacterium]